MALVKGRSIIYDMWAHPPDGSMRVSYYVFNYTNVKSLTLTMEERGNLTDDELRAIFGEDSQENLKVQQLGPYTYR